MSKVNNNSLIRSEASQAVKNNIGRLILMTLCVVGVILAASLGAGLLSALGMFISEGVGIFLMIVACIIVFFLLIGLSLGYTNSMIQMARGVQPPFSMLFSRMSSCLPGFGLSLLVELKVLLWALPGFAVVFAGAFIAGAARSPELLIVCYFVGLILIVALTIPAIYRYAMSTYFFADDPGCGVLGALNYSKSMMDGRKWQLFALTIPYVLVMFAAAVVVVLLSMIAMKLGAFGIILMFFVYIADLLLSVYISFLMSMAQVCFYEHNRN